MQVELNELKHFGSVLFEGSQETHLIELSECRTLMMKFAIIGKIETSNEKIVLWKYFVVFYEHVENNLTVGEVDYGLKNIAAEKEHIKQLTKMTMNLEILERQRRLMTN